MDKNLEHAFKCDLTDEEAGSYSPLVLAFIGDSAYELAIRTMFVKQGNARPKDLNRKKSALVKASAQSAMMEGLEALLTRREADIYRRGRNAKSPTTAKNATVQDYRRATGFEAMIGYLYLTGQFERMLTLIHAGTEFIWEKNNSGGEDRD